MTRPAWNYIPSFTLKLAVVDSDVELQKFLIIQSYCFLRVKLDTFITKGQSMLLWAPLTTNSEAYTEDLREADTQ